MRNPVRLEDREAPCPTTLEELEAESALADPWLADDADHLRAPADRPRERGFQSHGFILAADEAREAARAGDFKRGVERAHALQFVDLDWGAYPFELERAEIAQAEETRNQLRAVLG